MGEGAEAAPRSFWQLVLHSASLQAQRAHSTPLPYTVLPMVARVAASPCRCAPWDFRLQT